jgi:hypothetical protein
VNFLAQATLLSIGNNVFSIDLKSYYHRFDAIYLLHRPSNIKEPTRKDFIYVYASVWLLLSCKAALSSVVNSLMHPSSDRYRLLRGTRAARSDTTDSRWIHGGPLRLVKHESSRVSNGVKTALSAADDKNSPSSL